MSSPVSYNNSPNFVRAVQQWSELRNTLCSLGVDVIVLPKAPEYCKSTVFISNAGLLFKNTFIASHFRVVERQVEEIFFNNWFREHKFDVMQFAPDKSTFEGAGDAILDQKLNILWYGIGFRSSWPFKSVLDTYFENTDIIVRPLELIDSRFCFLDKCFCPLDTGELLWYPAAFSEHSKYIIESWYGDRAITVSEADACHFACNSISVGKNIIAPSISQDLEKYLVERGYTVNQVDMSEFIFSGGACKSLSLEVIQ